MCPERRLFNPAAAIDRLRDIGNVAGRALRSTPGPVQAAMVGVAIGVGVVGLASVYEHSPKPGPEIQQIYDLKETSRMNRFATDHPLVVVVVFAGVAVIFHRAIPWLDRKLEEFIKPPK